MEFHIAGKANDPNYADAESILDDLAMNLPDVTVKKHMRTAVTLQSILQHRALIHNHPCISAGFLARLVSATLPSNGLS